MLWIIVSILIILWLMGFLSSYTMGGFLHILLVLAVIVLVYDLLQKKRVT
jgi:hypothetical protein